MRTQEIIHALESGKVAKPLRFGLLLLLGVLLILTYQWRGYRNLASLEAMDQAQLARNMAQGRGYTTDFIRPFSVFLLEQQDAKKDPKDSVLASDPGMLKAGHPDMSNPPIYPVYLSLLMRVLPFEFDVNPNAPPEDAYQPDRLIALGNQVLLLVAMFLVFLLARRLFDESVAWISTFIFLGTELYWRFTVSGLSTMLLLVLFLAMCWCLVEVEQEGREPKGAAWRYFLFAVLTGVCLGLGSLTRYSFMILAVPVLLFLTIWGGQRRWQSGVIALGIFAAIVSPWITRNVKVSGAPFGTASYALVENYKYADYQLQRNFNPTLDSRDIIPAFWAKLLLNGRTILTQELPRIGGSWVGGFFLVGLLMIFRNPAINRFRLFLLGVMVFLIVIQAVIRTQQTTDNPEINPENLLILAAPLILIYGVAFFMVLLDNMSLPVIELRYMIIGLFGAVMCLPLFLFFLPPRPYHNVAFPPYYPQSIQRTARFLTPNEMMMADVPWATAWYGQRQSVWTTQTISDFFKINDTWKPIQALYLSPVTLDSKFASSFVNGSEKVWANTFTQAIFGADLRQREWPRRISLQFTEGDKKLVMPLSYWQSGWPNFFVVTFRREEL
jgi:hypothetical protein